MNVNIFIKHVRNCVMGAMPMLFIQMKLTNKQHLKLNISNICKTCVKWPLSKRPKIGFQDQLSLNAGQKCCSMFQREHAAILSTFIKQPFVIKIFVFVYF